MANRLIPRKTKVATELAKGLTLFDLLYIVACGFIFLAFFYSNLPFYFSFLVPGVLLMMVIKSNDIRLYVHLGWYFRFLAFRKSYVKYKEGEKNRAGDIRQLMPYEKISGKFIDYKEYFAGVVEIFPIEFFLLNDYKQDMIINSFTNALRRLGTGQSGSIYKINRAMLLDDYIAAEDKKYDDILKNKERGLYTDLELEGREFVFDSRMALLEHFNENSKIYKDHFYFVVYDKDRETLETTLEGIVSSLASTSNPVGAKILEGKELAVFLKNTYEKDFNEREINDIPENKLVNWVIPEKMKFRTSSVEINGKAYNHFILADYPMNVGNAWGYQFFNMDDVNVCINFKQMNRLAAERMIDTTILEMQAQLDKTFKESQKIEKESIVDTIRQLLVDLKNENESLFNCNFHIMCSTDKKKEVRARLKEGGFKFNEMFCRQVDAFISSNVSSRDNVQELMRGMQTSTLAGVFPFISNALMDNKGIYLGYNRFPAFIDFFKRDYERVNSNMIIIGRSGTGKSFAAKLLLAQLAADDAKIFICDPENEYEKLSKNLGGSIIDVGSGLKARFNPLHVMATLEDEDGEESDSFTQHLQFLEEFYNMILEGISPDALETLNRITVDLYSHFKINSKTDIKQLTAEDYPTFDDLYEFTIKKHDKEKDEYLRHNYKVVINYIAKFASGGRNSGLWNGPTNIRTNENFVVFGFRSLLANRNQSVARAQMLLTFKYLDNEIIKNRDYNLKNKTKRKIIIAVDEAHVFINPKYPIALDFMFQMAKRIRKYNGMQIILTQNIRDFMGSEDMIRQSSAIIAASQYSMIFSLSPNDVTELVKLYKNAGEINESEQDQIATAARGYAFFISGPLSRTSFQVEAMPEIIEFGGL